jgi:catechol 2,3-dioxygenase-like lactoylglutathione lyase family enzyme
MKTYPPFPRMHAGFRVKNLTDSVRFYSFFLGQAPVKLRPGYAKFELDQPPLVLSLSEKAGELPDKMPAHFGFQVESPEELARWMQTVEKHGLTIEKIEKATICCHALQDKFWVTDPDGIRWEVYYFIADAVQAG